MASAPVNLPGSAVQDAGKGQLPTLIGQTFGHYGIVEKVGVGGMGEVYRADDSHLQRKVAIKVLPGGTLADEQARRYFRKEAEALSKLNHPKGEAAPHHHSFRVEQKSGRRTGAEGFIIVLCECSTGFRQWVPAG